MNRQRQPSPAAANLPKLEQRASDHPPRIPLDTVAVYQSELNGPPNPRFTPAVSISIAQDMATCALPFPAAATSDNAAAASTRDDYCGAVNESRRLRRKRQNTLQILIIEPELQSDEIVAARAREDVVHAAEQPGAVDELVTERDAPARQHDFTEAEQVLANLEAIVEEQGVETEAARRFFDAETPSEWAETLREL